MSANDHESCSSSRHTQSVLNSLHSSRKQSPVLQNRMMSEDQVELGASSNNFISLNSTLMNHGRNNATAKPGNNLQKQQQLNHGFVDSKLHGVSDLIYRGDDENNSCKENMVNFAAVANNNFKNAYQNHSNFIAVGSENNYRMSGF